LSPAVTLTDRVGKIRCEKEGDYFMADDKITILVDSHAHLDLPDLRLTGRKSSRELEKMGLNPSSVHLMYLPAKA
jgi:hypothetical protein